MVVERLRVTSGFVESIGYFGLHKAVCGVSGLHNRPQAGTSGWAAETSRKEHGGYRPR